MAVDSTGLEARSVGSFYLFWLERNVRRRDFFKAHLTREVRGREKPVYGCQVNPGDAGDVDHLRALLDTVRGCLATVAGDGASGSRANVQYVADRGAKPFLKPRSNATARARGHPAWTRMVLGHRRHPVGWRRGYNPRANVEAVIWSLKARHGRALFSQSP